MWFCALDEEIYTIDVETSSFRSNWEHIIHSPKEEIKFDSIHSPYSPVIQVTKCCLVGRTITFYPA